MALALTIVLSQVGAAAASKMWSGSVFWRRIFRTTRKQLLFSLAAGPVRIIAAPFDFFYR